MKQYFAHADRTLLGHDARLIENSFSFHSHLWSWILDNDWKSAITSANAKVRFSQKIEGVTVFNKMRNSEIRKSRNVEP